ncbi:hypothetical protein HMPREF9630_00538 [Peptoanaerobacter stomatis]|uniref:Uncharacterized protein n=1 Tax=Peptoanaerobacter stomatis TaxID=796937 RepID=V9HQU3_9FIRM|nr:hypothetical protein HMPREF9630_00538 [Peptoanaerobacter stomatis]
MKEVIILKDSEYLIPTAEEHSLSTYNALCHRIFTNPDNTQKIFYNNILLKINDVYDIIERVNRKFSLHNNTEFSITIGVKFDDREYIEFSGYESFKHHDWNENKSILNMTITWDALLKIPNYEIPQRHRLILKMSNSMRPEEILKIIFSGEIDDMEELDKKFFPIVVRAEYISQRIGQELISIVEEWVKNNEQPTINPKYINYLKQKKYIISKAIELISTLLAFLALATIFLNFIDSVDFNNLGQISKENLKLLSLYNITIIAVLGFISRISYHFATKIYDLLRDYGFGYMFNITKGDKKLIDRLKKQEQHSNVRLVVNFLFALIFNVICSIIATGIFPYIFHK